MKRRRTRRDLTPTERARDRKRAIRTLGRPLAGKHPIHHHSLTQLVICESLEYHMFLHLREETVALGGNPNIERVCQHCGEVKDLQAFRKPRNDRTCGECALGPMGWALFVENEVHEALGEPLREVDWQRLETDKYAYWGLLDPYFTPDPFWD